MSFGNLALRDVILALSGVAAVYLLVLVFRLLALDKRRPAEQDDVIDVSAQTAVAQDAPVSSSIPPVESGGAHSELAASPITPSATPPATPSPATSPAPSTPSLPATAKHSVVRIYVKNASVEVPNMARTPKFAVRPDITVDLQINAQPAWENHLECSLRISLHARLNGMTLFLMEIEQCGLFLMHDTELTLLHNFVRETAQSVLFPYARKHLANLAVDAGFQPVILDPIDFSLLLRNANVSFPKA